MPIYLIHLTPKQEALLKSKAFQDELAQIDAGTMLPRRSHATLLSQVTSSMSSLASTSSTTINGKPATPEEEKATREFFDEFSNSTNAMWKSVETSFASIRKSSDKLFKKVRKT